MGVSLPEIVPAEWENQDIILYHGTALRYAESIANTGVDVNKGSPFTDFGRGFYATTDLLQAKKWDFKLVQSNMNDEPSVLKYIVERDVLAQFDVLWFTSSQTEIENFWSLVFHCRQGNTDHKRNRNMIMI